MQVLVQKGCLKGVGCDSIRSLTAQGKQALNEVLGLKHFLLDFSLIRERALQETLIWQDYMVYALLLGIADKVGSTPTSSRRSTSTPGRQPGPGITTT